VHFYKPIQIAEILYRNRLSGLSLDSLDNYRTVSKRWRDEISLRIVGNVSTSSSRFQDNVFEDNAMPPELLKELGHFNKEHGGIVEAYIYLSMINKMNDLGEIHKYLTEAKDSGFNLEDLLKLFSGNSGLTRSMDKVYEIIAYSLFDAIISALDVHVSVKLETDNAAMIADFSGFTEKVIGIKEGVSLDASARVFRVGSTNANDGGLDLWANFGPAIQVKHFSITANHLESITSGIKADKFIVVCTDADKQIIESVLKQSGTYPKVQSIVTLTDLRAWYSLATSDKYKDTVGVELLSSLLSEFEYEFPSNKEMPLFLTERGYDQIELPGDWNPARAEVVDG
jgi:type II restriction enzyme